MRRKRQTAAVLRKPVTESQRPARTASVQGDVVVPALQAALTGSLATGALALAYQMLKGAGWSWRVTAIVWLFVTGLAWLVLLSESRALLWAIESRLDVDLDGDGAAGIPQPDDRLVLVRGRPHAAETARERRRADFVAFVLGCQHDTSLRRWEGLGMSRERYSSWRDRLIDAGWAEWVDPASKRQGWRLLTSAQEIIGSLG